MIERIGHYEIEREIGRGGMGVVYLARDTRLERDVAVKSIPAHLAEDPARLQRFEREAKTLAGLSHSNIAGIYGIEQLDGANYLILEYVEGEDLAEILNRGPIAPDETLQLAAQIASGIEAAHDAGIIHRDLKPANIRVTHESVVKVLDFGLSRADDAGSSSMNNLDIPTMTTPARQHSPTIAGAIMGTAAYMSPEQARGRRIDRRTDIWAFGVVLYEMLTGASPFVGETVTDSIGAVLHKDIDLQSLPPTTPLHVHRVLERCLQRDKTQRFRDIGDVRHELLNPPALSPAMNSQSRGATAAVLIFVGLVLMALSAGAAWFVALGTDPETVETPLVRKIDLRTIPDARASDIKSPVISPDGRRVAYIHNGTVYLRELSSFEDVPVPSAQSARTIFWSPDSKHLGFSSPEGIFRIVNMSGGATEITNQQSTYTPQWTEDGRVIFCTGEDQFNNVASVPVIGGTVTAILEADPESTIDYHGAIMIPGTDVLIYIDHQNLSRTPILATDGSSTVEVVSFDDMFSSTFVWSETGHILFTRGSQGTDLWAIAFDPSSMQVQGNPFLVLANAMSPSVSLHGDLVVSRGEFNSSSDLVWINPDGSTELVTETDERVNNPILSPDGTRIAFSSGSTPDRVDVWIHNIERGFSSKLTRTPGLKIPAAWSSDGSELAVLNFKPTEENPFTTTFQFTNGTGESRDSFNGLLLDFDSTWSSAIKMDDPRTPEPLSEVIDLETREAIEEISIGFSFAGYNVGQINPQNDLFLYSTNENGQAEIYCTEYPSGGTRWRVSIDGGRGPIWSPDGTSVYFLKDNELYSVDLTRDPEIKFSWPTLVISESHFGESVIQQVTPTNTRDRFIGVTDRALEEGSQSTSLSIIQNWYTEFKENN